MITQYIHELTLYIGQEIQYNSCSFLDNGVTAPNYTADASGFPSNILDKHPSIK